VRIIIAQEIKKLTTSEAINVRKCYKKAWNIDRGSPNSGKAA
jgi:hypothetical protein